MAKPKLILVVITQDTSHRLFTGLINIRPLPQVAASNRTPLSRAAIMSWEPPISTATLNRTTQDMASRRRPLIIPMLRLAWLLPICSSQLVVSAWMDMTIHARPATVTPSSILRVNWCMPRLSSNSLNNNMPNSSMSRSNRPRSNRPSNSVRRRGSSMWLLRPTKSSRWGHKPRRRCNSINQSSRRLSRQQRPMCRATHLPRQRRLPATFSNLRTV